MPAPPILWTLLFLGLAMRLEVKKSVLGRYTLSYDCPHCGAGLTSPLNDAGKDDSCPDCEEVFAVPGSDKRNDIRAATEQRSQQKEFEKQRKREARRRMAIVILPYVAWFALIGGAPVANWTTDHFDSAVAAHTENKRQYQESLTEYDAKIAKLNQTKVFSTSYGRAYHRHYHYSGRNYSIGLADAVSRYSPCNVCNPPYVSLPDRPKPPTLTRSIDWRAAGWGLWVGMLAAPLGTLYGLSVAEQRQRQRQRRLADTIVAST